MSSDGRAPGDKLRQRRKPSLPRSFYHFIKTVSLFFIGAFFVFMAQVVIAGLFYSIPAAGPLLILSVVTYVGLSNYSSRKNLASLTDTGRYAVLFAARILAIMMFFACLFHINQSGTTFFSLFVGAVPGQFLLIGFIGVVVSIVAALKKSRHFAITMAVASIMLVGGSSIVMWSQVSLAKAHDITLTTAELLSAEDPAARSPDIELVYAQREDNGLSALLWQSTVETVASRPVVVMLHGGGFASGTPADMAPTASMLADRGYTVFSIEYRLAPPPRWKDASDDVVSFLRWLQVHRQQYGILGSKVVLVGNSAGGGLALNVAYGLKDESLDLGGDIAPVLPVGVAGMYPAADLRALYDATAYQDPRPVLNSYIGGRPDEFSSRWTYANPAEKIAPGLPPTLLVTGQHDHLVYASSVKAFADRVSAQGNQVELYTVPFADHSFDARFNSPASAVKRTLLLRWLDQLSR